MSVASKILCASLLLGGILFASCEDPVDYEPRSEFSFTMSNVPSKAEVEDAPKYNINFNSGNVQQVVNFVSQDGKRKWWVFEFQSIPTPTEKADSTFFPYCLSMKVDTNAVMEHVYGTRFFRNVIFYEDVYLKDIHPGEVNPETGNPWSEEDGFVRYGYKIFSNHGKLNITKISDHTISGTMKADMYLATIGGEAIDIEDTVLIPTRFDFKDILMVGVPIPEY